MKKVAIGLCALAVAAALGTAAIISSVDAEEKNSVGSEKALEIALNDAGVSKEKAKDKSSVFTKKNGKYKAVKTIKKAKTVTFTDTKLKKGTTYYYKVKAYKKVNGKKALGQFSTVKSVKIKK